MEITILFKRTSDFLKRIYIAISFLIVAILIASAEMGYITAKADMFETKIENADRYMRKNEYAEAFKICKEAESDWDDSTKIIDMLLIHDYVDSVGMKISLMKSFAENQNYDMYFSESTAAKKELASIKESEFPLVENIL